MQRLSQIKIHRRRQTQQAQMNTAVAQNKHWLTWQLFARYIWKSLAGLRVKETSWNASVDCRMHEIKAPDNKWKTNYTLERLFWGRTMHCITYIDYWESLRCHRTGWDGRTDCYQRICERQSESKFSKHMSGSEKQNGVSPILYLR